MESSYWTAKGYRTIENILNQVSKLKLISNKNGTTLNWYYFSVPCVGIDLEGLHHAFDVITRQVSIYNHIATSKKIMIINGASHLWWTMNQVRRFYVDHINFMFNFNTMEYHTMVTRTNKKQAKSSIPLLMNKRLAAQAICDALDTAYVANTLQGGTCFKINDTMICDGCGKKPAEDFFHRVCDNGCTDQVPLQLPHIIKPYGYIIIHDDYWINKFTKALNPDDFHKLTSKQFVQMIAPLFDGLDEL